MTFNQLLRSKVFMFLLVVVLGFGGYFFARELRRQYYIQGDLNVLEQQVTELEGRNQELRELIAYFKTESFEEKEIRSKLNLQKPGEHVVAIPEGIIAGVATNEQPEGPKDEKNWRLWWNYFFEE